MEREWREMDNGMDREKPLARTRTGSQMRKHTGGHARAFAHLRQRRTASKTLQAKKTRTHVCTLASKGTRAGMRTRRRGAAEPPRRVAGPTSGCRISVVPVLLSHPAPPNHPPNQPTNQPTLPHPTAAPFKKKKKKIRAKGK